MKKSLFPLYMLILFSSIIWLGGCTALIDTSTVKNRNPVELSTGDHNNDQSVLRDNNYYAKTYIEPLIDSAITWESWGNPQEIDPFLLLSYSFHRIIEENINITLFWSKKDQKYHIPAEMIETVLIRHFKLSESYLRSLKEYNSFDKAYLISSTYGKGGSFEIDKVSRQEKLVTIDFHYYAKETKEILKKVRLVVDVSQPDFKYLSCQVTPISPLLMDSENTPLALKPEIFSSNSPAGWSYTSKPKLFYFNAGRDIFGIEFDLTYDAASGQYAFIPGMGDCDKIISYTLTGTKLSVVLNGKYKLLYPGIPAIVGINKYVNEGGYVGMKDNYEMKPSSIVTGDDGNYQLTVQFDKTYQYGEITDVAFTFGKID